MWSTLENSTWSIKTYRVTLKSDNHQWKYKYQLLFHFTGFYIIFSLLPASCCSSMVKQLYVSHFSDNLIRNHSSAAGHPAKKCFLWQIPVIFDPQFSSEDHINNIDNTSYYNLRSITRLRRLLCQQDAEILIHVFITTRLACCDLLLAGLPDFSLHGSHFTQNSTA